MNKTLYSWKFKFHKVVRQQNAGVVEDFILPYSAVYLRIQKWKNDWKRSTFAKVIVKIKVVPFLWPTVCMHMYVWQNNLGLWIVTQVCLLILRQIDFNEVTRYLELMKCLWNNEMTATGCCIIHRRSEMIVISWLLVKIFFFILS